MQRNIVKILDFKHFDQCQEVVSEWQNQIESENQERLLEIVDEIEELALTEIKKINGEKRVKLSGFMQNIHSAKIGLL